MLIGPASLGLPAVDRLDGVVWAQWSTPQQDAFVLGYITASWAWADSIYVAASHDELTPAVRYVYDNLAPVSEASAIYLADAITDWYTANPKDVELYRVIHSLISTWGPEPQPAL